MTSTAVAASPQVIGAVYFNSALYGAAAKVFFQAICSVPTGGGTCFIDLWDYNGITNGGIPQEVPGSPLSTASSSFVLLSVEVASLEGGALPSGILQGRVWGSAGATVVVEGMLILVQ